MKNIRKDQIKILIMTIILLLSGFFVPFISLAAEINIGSYSANGKVYWDSMTEDTTNRWLYVFFEWFKK